MTEINTDEIRAGLQGDDHPSTEAEIHALCDALDVALARAEAAEADRDQWKQSWTTAIRWKDRELARAEAAESRIKEIEHRLELTGLPNYWLRCPLECLTDAEGTDQ